MVQTPSVGAEDDAWSERLSVSIINKKKKNNKTFITGEVAAEMGGTYRFTVQFTVLDKTQYLCNASIIIFHRRWPCDNTHCQNSKRNLKTRRSRGFSLNWNLSKY